LPRTFCPAFLMKSNIAIALFLSGIFAARDDGEEV
jgi:hypothetical protein